MDKEKEQVVSLALNNIMEISCLYATNNLGSIFNICLHRFLKGVISLIGMSFVSLGYAICMNKEYLSMNNKWIKWTAIDTVCCLIAMLLIIIDPAMAASFYAYSQNKYMCIFVNGGFSVTHPEIQPYAFTLKRFKKYLIDMKNGEAYTRPNPVFPGNNNNVVIDRTPAPADFCFRETAQFMIDHAKNNNKLKIWAFFVFIFVIKTTLFIPAIIYDIIQSKKFIIGMIRDDILYSIRGIGISFAGIFLTPVMMEELVVAYLSVVNDYMSRGGNIGLPINGNPFSEELLRKEINQ